MPEENNPVDFHLGLPLSVFAFQKGCHVVAHFTSNFWIIDIYDLLATPGSSKPRVGSRADNYYSAELGAREFLSEMPDAPPCARRLPQPPAPEGKSQEKK